MPDDHSEVVPLLPIPNRTVKRLCADDSAGSRVKVGHCQAITKKGPDLDDRAPFPLCVGARVSFEVTPVPTSTQHSGPVPANLQHPDLVALRQNHPLPILPINHHLQHHPRLVARQVHWRDRVTCGCLPERRGVRRT